MTVAAEERVAVRPGIERLLGPRSVAVVGASDKPGALGASVIANLDRNGFAGAVYPINPNRATIAGRPCLPDIAALPDGVDVAVLAIPRAGVLPAVRALAARGVGAAVIFSAGFAEGGEAGLAEQREIAAVAADAGMVIEGPNCLGLVNHLTGAPLTFVETRVSPPAAGRRGIGIVSQSGAMAAVLGTVFQARELGLTVSVSTGNEAASGVEDYVEWLVGEPATQVIAMIVEQFRHPARFLAAARAAHAKGKTIVLLHPGKSGAARESAATHTGAMAGDYDLMRLLVGQAGVVFAETLEELGDIAEIAARCPVLPESGVAVLGESGAFKALMLDLAEDLALPLPLLDDTNAPALRAALPEFVGVSNPLDMTAQGLVDPDLYARTLSALLGDERIGTVLIGIIQTDPVTTGIKVPPLLRALDERDGGHGGGGKAVIFAGLDEGAPIPPAEIAALRERGVPCFPSSERALRAVARLASLGVETARTGVAATALDLPEAGGVIPEHRAKALLASAGFAFPTARLVTTVAAAQAAAAAIGYPVVLKAQSPQLSHKSDAGGVAVGIADADALAAAWARMDADVARHLRGVALDGILVEAMGARGLEMIIGARRDPDWGAAVLVGFGGVQAEVLKDVALIAPGMTRAAIVAAIRRLRSAALLNGWRGTPALDVEALAALVERLAGVMDASPRILEVDLNPVILYPEGQGAVALDALMLVKSV
ncbi:MAG: CoA-binding protein [Sphingomonas sp.]|nr:MAG: CoA-binding protein [Sphingomonas sp.]